MSGAVAYRARRVWLAAVLASLSSRAQAERTDLASVVSTVAATIWLNRSGDPRVTEAARNKASPPRSKGSAGPTRGCARAGSEPGTAEIAGCGVDDDQLTVLDLCHGQTTICGAVQTQTEDTADTDKAGTLGQFRTG